MTNPRQHTGFSMIEVLVAVLVLAVGVLGVGAVQMMALRNTANTELRTQVNLYSQELAERVRADLANVTGYVVSTPTASCPSGRLLDWCTSFKRAVPASRFKVTWDPGTRTLDIGVWWTERQNYVKDKEGREVATAESSFFHQVRFPQ